MTGGAPITEPNEPVWQPIWRIANGGVLQHAWQTRGDKWWSLCSPTMWPRQGKDLHKGDTQRCDTCVQRIDTGP